MRPATSSSGSPSLMRLAAMASGWRAGCAPMRFEAYVIHPSSVPVSREHRRAKTDRLDTELPSVSSQLATLNRTRKHSKTHCYWNRPPQSNKSAAVLATTRASRLRDGLRPPLTAAPGSGQGKLGRDEEMVAVRSNKSRCGASTKVPSGYHRLTMEYVRQPTNGRCIGLEDALDYNAVPCQGFPRQLPVRSEISLRAMRTPEIDVSCSHVHYWSLSVSPSVERSIVYVNGPVGLGFGTSSKMTIRSGPSRTSLGGTYCVGIPCVHSSLDLSTVCPMTILGTELAVA
jgi:hypothetical protein